MKAYNPLQTLDLLMISKRNNTLTMNDECILNDNFDEEPPIQGPQRQPPIGQPVKINFTVIMLCTQGEVHMRMNLVEYILKKNSVLLALPSTIMEFLSASPDCKVCSIAFSGEIYEKVRHKQGLLILQKHVHQQALIHMSEEDTLEFVDLYKIIRKKIAAPEYKFKQEAVGGVMQIIFCNIFQMISEKPEFANEKTESRRHLIFARFLSAVEKYHVSERSISFYANELCITPKYLSQVIYAESGRHATDWIRDYVILEAKALLNTEQYTVQQVSDKLHFANSSFFGKYFKAVVGCSPRKYQLKTT